MGLPAYKPDIEPETRPNLRLVGNNDEQSPQKSTAQQLSSAESRPNLRAIDGGGESTPERANLRAVNDINGAEKANNNPATATPFNNNVTPKTPTKPITTNQFAMSLIRRGGPAAGLGIVLLIAGMFGTAIPGSLMLNLKENLVLNWDQQSITSEIRSRSVLSKRLGAKTTSGACDVIKIALACRYQKPSNRVIQKLEEANIRALRADGTVIDKQKFLAGERPVYYSYASNLDEASLKKAVTSGDFAGYKLVSATGFADALNNDAAFRSAFRRAYNPRWVNWFDDAAIKFLGSVGLSKKPNAKLTAAASESAIEEAVQELADGEKNKHGGTPDGIERGIKEAVDAESKNFADDATKKLKKVKGDSAIFIATGGCIVAKAPGFFSSILAKIRTAQMAAVVFPAIMVVADAIKAGKATPEMVSNSANLLTQTYKKADGTTLMSAMDSGAIKYGIMKDVGSAQNSTTLKKYIPGYTGSSTFDKFAAAGQSKQVKDTCNFLSSTELQLAMDGFKVAKGLAGPAGWVSLGADAVLIVSDWTGLSNMVVDNIIGPLVQQAVSKIAGIVPWKDIVGLIAGDIGKNAKGEEFGDMVGVLATVMANKANMAGNLPLSKKQAKVFKETAADPVKLAWAQEDRLTHSPLDMSNPNTVMGSIATQFMYYYPKGVSLASGLSSTMNMFGSLLKNSLNPKAMAEDIEYDGLCTADMDFAIADSEVAAGPLCDVQYGIPAEYLADDPDNVLTYLYNEKQIDIKGEIIKDSELDAWVQECNSNKNYNLGHCMAGGKRQAYYGLYLIDKQNTDAMDNGVAQDTGGSATASTGSGGSVSLVDPSKWAVQPNHNGLIDKSSAEWIKWAAAIGGNGNNSTGVLKPIDLPGSEICSQDNRLNQDGGGNYYNPNAAASAKALVEAYNKANPGRYLVPGACFRSISAQEGAYIRSGGHKDPSTGTWSGGNGSAAIPEASNHGWGLAIDFRIATSAGNMGDSITSYGSNDYKWMVDNGYQFGWVNPINMREGGSGPHEPWHFQYVGPLYGD